MVSVVRTDGPKAHQDALLAAAAVHQAASVGATAAQLKAADIAFARSARASCLNNNGGAGVAQFVSMLMELGTGGS
jgi:hypothetical protein